MKKSNLFWGLGFILLAALIIIGNMGFLGGLGFWTLFFSILLAIWFITSLTKLEWAGIFFSLAGFVILYDEMLGLTSLTPWPVIGAAAFLTTGFHLLFGNMQKKRRMKKQFMDRTGQRRDQQMENEQYFRCAVSMGSAVKYVNCPQLREACLENSFGNLVVYFDSSVLSEVGANIYVKNHFGKTTLYVPAAWNLQINVSESFGHVSTVGVPSGAGLKPVLLGGDTSFGEVVVYYI